MPDVTADAHAAARLVNVADAPEEGSFATMATHRSGALVFGVSAGGVPGAAARIRDAIASRFDARYARALAALSRCAERSWTRGAGTEWRARAAEVIDDDFCERVEKRHYRRAGGRMAVIVLGVSHHGAPLDVREKLAFRSVEVLPALERLRAASRTRTKACCCPRATAPSSIVVEGAGDAVADGWALLSERLGADASRYGYVRRDRDAAAHLFRVASGMDSMVVGEAQIHGQVRDAWEMSRAAAGTVLNRLFQSALLTAGRVRSETTLGHGALSVSSAAVQLSKKIFGGLVGRRAMVLGAGEMAELALASLQQEGVRAAIVANRTFERATELAAQYGATAVHYDDAWDALADVDLLLCSTASPHPVVSAERVRAAVARRGDRPLCILDIAMPRDVDPAVRDAGQRLPVRPRRPARGRQREPRAAARASCPPPRR